MMVVLEDLETHIPLIPNELYIEAPTEMGKNAMQEILILTTLLQ
jgi:hypothetical protein